MIFGSCDEVRLHVPVYVDTNTDRVLGVMNTAYPNFFKNYCHPSARLVRRDVPVTVPGDIGIVDWISRRCERCSFSGGDQLGVAWCILKVLYRYST